MLANNWHELEPAWNWSISLPLSRPLADDARAHIVHFTGNLKPWKYRGRHSSHREYYEYLDRTVWSGWRPPHGWRAAALRSYHRAGVRRILLPSERLGTRFWKALTGRVATADDVASVT